MKYVIKKLLRENLERETLNGFYNRFKQTNSNPNFLDNNFKNPDFELRLVNEGGVKFINFGQGEKNKCETNSFKFIKQMVMSNDHRYYPVSGWAFMKSTTYFEHFWVYDAVNDMFVDVTPLEGEYPYAYGGVINKNINDEILNAKSVFDIDFFKGKVASSLYASCEANKSNPKLDSFKTSGDSYESRLFNYISKTEKYSELNKFIQDNNINSVTELKSLLPRLEDKMMSVRNNREYNLYNTLIDQIKALQHNIY